MIKPEDIPQFAGNLDQLEADAKSLTTDAGNIRTDGSNIHSTFQGLSAYYHSPDADQLFATTKPVSTQADSFASDVEKVASALSSYASEVRPIAAKLKDLQTQAATFVASVKGDDDWKYDKNKVDHNNDLLHQVDTAVAAFWAAERTAANKIDSVFGGTQYVGNDGSNKADMYGYTGDQLDGAQVPWGSTEQQSHHWYDVGYWTKSFVWDGLIVDGIWGTIKGLGTLVGFGGLKNFEQAWKGIGELALGLTITQFDPAFLATPDSMLPGWLKDAKNAPIAFAKSMVAWDEWKKNPATAAGSVSFNILTCVIAPLKIGKLGALGEAGEAGTGAKALSALAKVGEVIDPMTYVSKALSPLLGRLPTVAQLTAALDHLRGSDLKGLDDLSSLHSTELPDGSLKLPDGSVLYRNGDLRLPNGEIKPPAFREPSPVLAHTQVPAPRELVGAHVGGGTHELGHVPGGHEPSLGGGGAGHQVHNSVGGGGADTAHAPSHTGGDATAAGGHAGHPDGSGTTAGHGSHQPGSGPDGGLPGQRGHGGSGGGGDAGHQGTGHQGNQHLTQAQREEIVRKQVERANDDPAYFKKYYHVNGHRDSIQALDDNGNEVPQLRANPDPNGPKWVLATDGPPPIAPRFHTPDYVHGYRLPEDHPQLPKLDDSAAARHHAISVDQAAHKQLEQLKNAHQAAVHTGDPQAIADAQHQIDQGKLAHKAPHTEMTVNSESHGDRTAEFHAVPEHFPDAVRIDNRATGNNRFDQIWKTEDGHYIIVEAKGGPHTQLGDRQVGGGIRAMQGTREYFDSILEEMRTRGFHDPQEAALRRELQKALKQGDVSYLLVKGKDDGAGQYAGYLMKYFNID